MSKAIVFFAGLLFGVIITFSLSHATDSASTLGFVDTRQEPAKSQRKILIDNDRVQVIDYTLMPGDHTLGMHTHQYPHVDVILQGGSVEVKNTNGTTAHLTAYRDSVYYRPGNVTHAPINTGKTAIRMIEVHVK
jgi:mannose-6-phosphate isomerase-like protein (cupin superfamily)